jgi:hypothetical protein
MIARLRKYFRAGFLLSSLALCVAPVFADTTFTMNFDENGNGTTCIYLGSCSANTWYVGIDPTTGLSTLIYNLPAITSTGEVGITDAAGLSDVIDFFNDGNGGHMAYYSLGIGPDLADSVTGFGSSVFDDARAFSIS